MCEHFNIYFASVFTHEDYSNPPTPIRICDFNVTCADLQFDESSVSTAIIKLRPDKAMGPDGIAPKLILETENQIKHPLSIPFV